MSPTSSSSRSGLDGAASTGRRWLVPALIVLVAMLLVAAILVFNQSTDREEPSTGAGSRESDTTEETQEDAAAHVEEVNEPDLSDVETRDEDDLQALGPVDAPVGLVVYSDYQCPYCAAWSEETLPVMKEYAERGDLRIEWRDVNVFGPESEQASKAAHAAALQDSFWAYHDELFAGGEHRSGGELSEDALTDLASEMGLDPERFRTDMESEETATAVEEYAQQGVDLGAFSTPSFVVAGTPIVGAQPTDVFVESIDAALETQD